MKTFDDALEKEEVVGTNTSSMREAMDVVFSTNDVKVKSDLKETQVVPILKLFMFDTVYKCPITSIIANEFLTLSISKGRQSRKEFVELARSTINQEMNQGSMLGGVFGLGK